MMSYNYFAEVYDDLTQNVDYDARSKYLASFLNDAGIKTGSDIIDLACGTGSIAVRLADMGYRVTGIDLSPEMLSIADFKSAGKVSLINADMLNFSLSQPADACVCTLDSINHLSSINEVIKAFENVYNSIKDNGIFIFDVNTVYKHNFVLADNTFVFDEEDYFLSWDNELIDDNKVRIIIDIFVKENNIYKRFSEEFVEAAYSVEDLKAALMPYFNVLGVYDDMTRKEPKSDSERIYFVCKRK